MLSLGSAGRNILSCSRMGATGRACRTGGPPVASPVPERVRGFFASDDEPLACNRRIWIAGIHDYQPSSAIAAPHCYIATTAELLPRVRSASAYDRVFASGRTDRPALNVRIGWLPVTEYSGVRSSADRISGSRRPLNNKRGSGCGARGAYRRTSSHRSLERVWRRQNRGLPASASFPWRHSWSCGC